MSQLDLERQLTMLGLPLAKKLALFLNISLVTTKCKEAK